ncbi:MAG: hypothetical protein ACE141_12740 [Bryobacteraceae bacterium]
MLPSRCLLAAVLAAAQVLAEVPGAAVPHPSGEEERPEGFHWGRAAWQSFLFLGIEHSFRLTQAKTRSEFHGKFFRDYALSVRNLGGWGDGDSPLTNYIAHPMQGAVAGFVQIQNDPSGITQEFGRSGAYWRSRFKSMAWSALYSTQFEIGPVSEATIGNVGKKKGTSGYTDLVMTPVGGLGITILEDAVDRFLLRRLERPGRGENWQCILRVALNPQRSMANVLRLRWPWHRDTRHLSQANP